MANKITQDIEKLKICIDQKNPIEASRIIEQLNSNFDDEISTSEINLHINRIFDKDIGLIAFLKKTLKVNKLFKNANNEIFKLFQKIIRQYKKQTEDYAEFIVEIAIDFVLSTMVSAVEKENSILVIQELVSNRLCRNEKMEYLLSNLIRIVNFKKPPARFLQYTYELLGMITRDYPDCLSNGQDISIRNMFLNTLETTLLNQEEISFSALNGAINGLNYFLNNFGPSPQQEPIICQRIYACVKKLSDPIGESKNLTIFRASLNLLTAHSFIISEQLFKENQYWHKILLKWLKLGSWENRRTAIFALHSFHREISRQIEERKNPIEDTELLRFFIQYFKLTLQSPQSEAYEVRIAIRGFGLMAGPCRAVLPTENLNELLTLVMQRTEYIVRAQNSKSNEMLEHYPDFVQALSQIMQHVRELTGVQKTSLENIIIRLIRDFHYLSTAHHSLAINSLLTTFLNLYQLGGSVLDAVLEKCILQGVIWTCSHKLVYDAVTENPTNSYDWKLNVTYKSYLPLWFGLIGKLNNIGDNVEENKTIFSHIQSTIYQQLLSTLFIILDKLNLSTNKRKFINTITNQEEQELYFCDPNYDLTPVRPKDFHIFFNLVQFYRDILVGKYNYGDQYVNNLEHWQQFKPFMNQYCNFIMKKTFSYTLVSGFVRFMTIAMDIANKIEYFKTNNGEISEENHSDLSLRSSILFYIKIHIAKVQQTYGELQIAIMEFIFATPSILLWPYLLELIPVFVIAFDIGKSMLSLANRALSAMERIGKSININNNNTNILDKWEIVLKNILPCFDPYLQTNGFTSDGVIDVEIISTIKQRQSKRIKKVFKNNSMNISMTNETVKFQKRILLYLGTLEPSICSNLITNELHKPNLTKLDLNENIKLTLNYENLKPIIYLDTLIPRICLIARQSSDRKTKIAACELTHSIVLYLIGTQKYQNGGAIWRELFTNVLYLSCDGDLASQQMFEPLIIEIMHYMSHRSRLSNDGVTIMFDCLMNGISHPINSLVRDMAARCLREFMIWSRKQMDAGLSLAGEMMTTDATTQISPDKTIWKKLKIYSFDSAAEKRNGAALAFNNLYQILREIDTVVDLYWLDMLYTFCINFLMTEEFLTSSSNQQQDFQQISTSLDHVSRVICERSNIFNTENSLRQNPIAFRDKNNNQIILSGAINWLFTQCGAKQQHYRHKCIELFEKLVVTCNVYKSVDSFFEKTQTTTSILGICEGIGSTGINQRSNLDFICTLSQSPYESIYIWLEYLLTSLDCYVWLIGGNKLIKIRHTILQHKSTTILRAINYFLKNIADFQINDIIQCVYPEFYQKSNNFDNNDNLSSTLIDNVSIIDKFEQIKCTILIRIMDFFIKLLPINDKYILSEWFWLNSIDKLTQIFVRLIFAPQELGFDLKNCEIQEKLPIKIKQFLKTIKTTKLLPTQVNCLNETIIAELKIQYNRCVETIDCYFNKMNISICELNHIKGIDLLFNYYQQDKQLDVFEFLKNKTLLLDLFMKLKENNNYARKLSPDIKLYSNQLIKLCFYQNPNEQLIKLMLNVDELEISSQNQQQRIDEPLQIKTINHGNHFINTFKYSIYDYLLKTPELTIKELSKHINSTNILFICEQFIELINYVNKYKQKDIDSVIKPLVKWLLTIWGQLIEIEQENKQSEKMSFILIDLMSHIALICPHRLSDIQRLAVKFDDWLLEKLTNTNNSMELKIRAIFLLPCLMDEHDLEQKSIEIALNSVYSQYFPLRSSEFLPGSLERSSFCNLFQSILDSLIASKSPQLLRFLINATAADHLHIMEFEIQQCLKVFVENQTIRQQICSLKIPFKLFHTSQSLDPLIRQGIIKRFLLTMIRCSCVEAVAQFYTEIMKQLFEMTQANYGGNISGGIIIENALITRTAAYQLIEALLAAVPKSRLQDKNHPIGKYLPDAQTKELIGLLTKKAHAIRSEIFVTENSVCMELFRIYQCAGYNAMCALISNTQMDLKYYEMLLFKENPQKNELIWQKIINCTNNDLYINELNTEFVNYPKIKDRLVSIRKLNDNNYQNREFNSPKYIQTQSVFESSLSQDVTKIDLSNSTIRTSNQVLLAGAGTTTAAAAENREPTQKTTLIQLETVPINNHECMDVLCAVIEHMFENEITPRYKDNENETTNRFVRTTPQWAISLANILNDSNQPRNVRYFLAKCIENLRHLFCNYAQTITVAVLNFLDNECDKLNTIGLNYFLLELIVMLLEWNNNYKIQSPREHCAASSILKFLMEHSYSDRRDIFKQRLEIIKLMIEKWYAVINLPKQLLYDSINRTKRNDSTENCCGIQLNGIILANNLQPWSDISAQQYLRSLLICLDNESLIIYQPAAHLIGMCLDKLMGETVDTVATSSVASTSAQSEQQQMNADNPTNENYLYLIEKLWKLQKQRNEKKFTDIIFGIHKNYPQIIDNFLIIIGNLITTSTGAIKRTYLEMYLSRMMSVYLDNIFGEIIAIGIMDLFKFNEYQLLALHILNKSLPSLTTKQIKHFLPELITLSESTRAECRDLVMEIFMYILEIKNQPVDYELNNKSLSILLNGLIDSDVQIQNRIFNYWSNNKRLSSNINDRFIELFDKLYHTNSERYFLNYSTQLLLEPAILNPDSTKQLFPNEQLADETTSTDTKFIEYDVDVGWKHENNTLKAPLFMESQQQRQTLTINSTLSQQQHPTTQSHHYNFLRATATNLAFEPTLNPHVLTQTNNQFSLQTQNSMLFTIEPQILNRRSERIVHNTTTANKDSSFSYLRQRFLHDKSKQLTKQQAAIKAIDRNDFKQIQQKQLKQKSERQIILYRRYRVGDYPDLMINSLAILLPLKGLIKYDKLLARQLFIGIFRAVLLELNYIERKTFLISCGDFIQRIFTQTKHCDTVLFGTLMELALCEPKFFNFPPELVATFSNTNQMMAIGILYIEERIINEWDTLNLPSTSTETSTKKTAATIDHEQEHWLKLSHMYRALSELDVVAGIFSEKLNVDELIPRAIHFEMEYNYKEAQSIYKQIIDRSRLIEQDFAYQSYFQLFERLGDWQQLAQVCETQIDNGNYDELWADEWNMENLLPCIMRSKLREILNGYDDSCQEFLKYLELWLRDTDKFDYMSIHFGEELMMLYIANQDYHNARVFADRHLTAFLSEWHNLTVLSTKVRLKKIQSIRTVTEIYKYTDLLLKKGTTDKRLTLLNKNSKEIKEINQRWLSSRPQLCDSTDLWSSILAYRTQICALLLPINEANDLTTSLMDIQFQLLDVALHQKNIPLSNHIIVSLSEQQNSNWLIARSKQQSLKGVRLKQPSAQLDVHLKSWDCLNKILTEQQTDDDDDEANNTNQPTRINKIINIKVLEELSNISQRIFNVIPRLIGPEQRVRTINEIEKRTVQFPGPNCDLRLYQFNLNCLEMCIDLTHELLTSNSPTTGNDVGENNELTIKNRSLNYSMGDAYYRLANYCYECSTDVRLCEQIPPVEEIVIRSVLKGMALNSKMARQMFPQLMEINKLKVDENLQRIFNIEILPVAEWMFLGWIPQLLSVLTYDKESFLDKILLRLAKSYPVAVIYPFQLSHEQYIQQFTSTEVDNVDNVENIVIYKPRPIIQQILEQIRNQKTDLFIKNIMYVCLPEKMLLFQLTELYSTIITSIQTEKTVTNKLIRKNIGQIIEICYPTSSDIIIGRFYHERLLNYKQPILNLYETISIAGISSIAIDETTVLPILRDLIQKLTSTIKMKNFIGLFEMLTLNKLNAWLNNYHWCGEEEYIEIPGQYLGDQKPIIEKHIKLVKLNETIKVYQSTKTLPIKLIFHGNDGKKYEFIIKYGEDLRQDQRIQQLLKIMSNQLKSDEMCLNHRLEIDTYTVVPINLNCGLLSCVKDTVSLKDIIDKSLVKHSDANSLKKVLNLNKKHMDFITKASIGLECEKIPLYFFGNAVNKYSRLEIITNFKGLVNEFPEFILKSGLRNLCNSPESYFSLRNNFATSLAAMSIAHWILGISDRHLSNVLLNTRTGRLVGIDFGLSFGAGIQNQPVPDLLPFRLTPQFVQTMQPLGVTGLITKCMTYSLRCYSNAKHILKACMDVFINEPSIDWLALAKLRNTELMNQDTEGLTSKADDATTVNSSNNLYTDNWAPKTRIQIACRKLNGANPKILIAEQLKIGGIANHPEYLANYLKFLNGHEQFNRRAKFHDLELTVEEQVECLLDIAMDDALLGICWTGFQPWI